MPSRSYYVYIMTNQRDSVLYVGMTNDLQRRVGEHKTHRYPGSFTHQYSLHKLVYYETTPDVYAAIAREKQLKAGSRAKKEALIQGMNPKWEDLSEGF